MRSAIRLRAAGCSTQKRRFSRRSQMIQLDAYRPIRIEVEAARELWPDYQVGRSSRDAIGSRFGVIDECSEVADPLESVLCFRFASHDCCPNRVLRRVRAIVTQTHFAINQRCYYSYRDACECWRCNRDACVPPSISRCEY